MDVLKKTDQQEKFSYDKLGLSIRAANSGTDEPLDIELLLAEFQNLIADKDFITTGQIYTVVAGQLFTKGALKTLKNYAEFKSAAEEPG